VLIGPKFAGYPTWGLQALVTVEIRGMNRLPWETSRFYIKMYKYNNIRTYIDTHMQA